jgi:hypothetical protein
VIRVDDLHAPRPPADTEGRADDQPARQITAESTDRPEVEVVTADRWSADRLSDARTRADLAALTAALDAADRGGAQ